MGGPHTTYSTVTEVTIPISCPFPDPSTGLGWLLTLALLLSCCWPTPTGQPPSHLLSLPSLRLAFSSCIFSTLLVPVPERLNALAVLQRHSRFESSPSVMGRLAVVLARNGTLVLTWLGQQEPVHQEAAVGDGSKAGRKILRVHGRDEGTRRDRRLGVMPVWRRPPTPLQPLGWDAKPSLLSGSQGL